MQHNHRSSTAQPETVACGCRRCCSPPFGLNHFQDGPISPYIYSPLLFYEMMGRTFLMYDDYYHRINAIGTDDIRFCTRCNCSIIVMKGLRSKLVSFVVVLLSHFVLAMVPHIFLSLSLLAMLPIAALVMVTTYAFAGWFRRFLGIAASAPAMVICHILFLFGVHITVIRRGIPSLLDASLNIECILLLIGLYRIFSSDPGLVSIESTCTGVLGQTDPSEVDLQDKGSPFILRVRNCNSCKRSVKGFDHHCPAFGNCIGQKNHHQFMILLVGFIITEATYTISSNQCIQALTVAHRMRFERTLSGHLVISTLLFSSLQVLWQMPFLTWHIYCICCNIKTEEWVNWRKYREFQRIAQPQQASRPTETRFMNPYNIGILSNIREYLNPYNRSRL